LKLFILATIVLALCSLAPAETPTLAKAQNAQEAANRLTQKNAAESAPHSPFSTADCVFTFTSGANNTFLKYCVTANGNVTVFESPSGQEHIAIGKDGEGYGLCDFTDKKVQYFDYAEFGDSGNWGLPSVVSQTRNSVKIARTTNDGIWTLTQAFTQVTGNLPAVKITMTLKNNTAIDRDALLIRYADVDAAGLSKNNFDSTINSAFGWNSVGASGPFGLVLQNFGESSIPDYAGFAQTVPAGPAPCSPFAHVLSGARSVNDGSIFMVYEAVVPHGTSQTAAVSYKGF